MDEKQQTGAAVAPDLLAHPDVVALLNQLQRSAPALTRILQRLEEFQNSGALDTVVDLADVLHAARLSVSDGMIARIGDDLRVGLELIDLLMISGIPERAPALLEAAREAAEAASRTPGSIGLWDLVKAIREPEVQYALKFMLALARRLPAAASG